MNKEILEQIANPNGKVDLEFVLSGNRTSIKDLVTTPPFLVQRALYPSVDIPSMAHVYLMSSSGGILQGDKFNIRIKSGNETISRISTQAATKIHPMDNNYAEQDINLEIGANSYLEFVPFQLIPYKESKFIQNVKITMESNSNLFYSEVLTAGRIASGETFEMDLCKLNLQLYDNTEKLLFSDMLQLDSKQPKSLIKTVFCSKHILATVYLVGSRLASEKIRDFISETLYDKTMTGCSLLPHSCGLVIRMLSDDYSDVYSKISELACLSRKMCLKNSA